MAKKIEWRMIKSFPRYDVSNTGLIRNAFTGKILKPIKHNKLGHLCFFPKRGMKTYIHRAVLIAFSGDAPLGKICRHLDGNPTNNNIENLCWGTYKENGKDSVLHGTTKTGSEAFGSKLDDEQVKKIRFLSKYGYSSRLLANKFNVSHTTIQKVIRKERY